MSNYDKEVKDIYTMLNQVADNITELTEISSKHTETLGYVIRMIQSIHQRLERLEGQKEIPPENLN